MKKRVIAIVLVLLLAVSLLPAAALAEDGMYISVGGKAFTKLDQTISVGGGTAKFTWTDENPLLTLNNVNITSFEKIAAFQDGSAIYAGIVIEGDHDIDVVINGSCSITAPAHGSDSIYEGIFFSGMRCEITGGSLNIKNTDIGVDESGYTDSSGYTYGSSMSFCNSALNINCSGGDAIYAEGGVGIQCDAAITTNGFFGIEARSLSVGKKLTVNITPDMSYGVGDAAAIMCQNMTMSNTGSINATVNYDSGSRQAAEDIYVFGVSADEMHDCYNIKSVVNVKGNAPVSAFAITGDFVTLYGTGNYAECNFSGAHNPSMAIMANKLFKTTEYTAVQAIINGASVGDCAFVSLDNNAYNVIGTLYASVDSDYALPLLIRSEKTLSAVRYTPGINIALPENGTFVDIEDEELGKFVTVIDDNRNIAKDVVLSKNTYPFIDIEYASVAPYKDAILWANDMNITTGFTPVEFRPSATCSRGQVVTFLWRAKGCPEPATTVNPFEDVAATSPFYKAILWAYENGITTGFDATHFKPSANCSRAQVVTFLWRAEGEPEPETENNPFTDVSAEGSTAPYYKAILWAAENGITSGYGNNDFRPSATCTRGQIVTFIYRALKDSTPDKPQGKKIVNVTIDTNKEPTEDMYFIDHTHNYINPVASFPAVCTVEYSDGTSEDIVLNINQEVEEMPENWAELVAFNDYNVYIRYYAYDLYQTYGTDDRWCLLGFDVRNLKIHMRSAADEIIKLEDGSLLTLQYTPPVEEQVLRIVNRLDLNTGKLQTVISGANAVDWQIADDTIYYVNKSSTYNSATGEVTYYYKVCSDGIYEIKYEELAIFTNIQPVFDETGYTVTETVDGKEVSTHYDFPKI